MDHLPYPQNPGQPPLEVPFLCSEAILGGYTIEELYSMPLKKFLVLHRIRGIFLGHGHSHVAAIAQAGIYFRMLRVVVGETFNSGDFIDQSTATNRRIVTLKRLEQIGGWKHPEDRYMALLQLSSEMALNDNFGLKLVIDEAQQLSLLKSPCCEIGLSIIALLWTIAPRFIQYFRWRHAPDGRGLLQQRMVASGWCPYWTKIYSQKFSPFLLYYLSGLPQARRRGHISCKRNRPCLNDDVKYDTYRTRHAYGCKTSKCVFKGPDVKKLESIVSQSGVPLIQLRRRSASHAVELDIVEHVSDRPFIAISHVWSGGLGNFNANTLPQCQIDFLYENVRRFRWRKLRESFLRNHRELITDILEGKKPDSREDTILKACLLFHIYEKSELPPSQSMIPNLHRNRQDSFVKIVKNLVVPTIGYVIEDLTADVYIWIDTLCIPSDPTIGQKEILKRKAIDKMPLIYAIAMHVLVIDQTVLRLSMNGPDLPLAAQLVTSPWMTRSWTFQEGCLAQKISFLMLDGEVAPESLLSTQRRKNASALYTWTWEAALVGECIRSFQDMHEMSRLSVSGPAEVANTQSFIQIWNELAVRRTSIPEDLHGLLAVLTGLSVREIFVDDQGEKRSPSERMLAVLRAQPLLPLSMLFIQYRSYTPMCEDVAWVPRFPTGYLVHCKENMVWRDDSTELRLPSCEGRVLYLIKPDGLPLSMDGNFKLFFNDGRIDTRGEVNSTRRVVSIKLLPQTPEQLATHSPTAKFVFILDQSSVFGACCVAGDYAEGVSPVRLRFVCPLQYKKGDTESCHSGDPHHVQPIANSEREILLDCESSIWPTTRYRRPSAKRLQRSLEFPMSVFVIVYWISYAIALHLHLRRYLNDAGSEGSSFWTVKILSRVGGLHPSMAFLSAIAQSRSFVQTIRVVNLPIVRLFNLFTMDLPQLEQHADRVRQERYAKLLDYDGVARQSTRLSVELSCHYRMNWSFTAITLLTFYIIHRFSAPSVASSSAIEIKIHRLSTWGMVGELVGRVVFEIVWRYFRLDLEP